MIEIKECPQCHSKPKITELNREYGVRSRIISCPKLCNVIESNGKFFGNADFYIRYDGNEDDEIIYRLWNERIRK